MRGVRVVACLVPAAFGFTAVSAQDTAESAQVRQGGQLYAQHCQLCHGADGRGGSAFPRPIWGAGHDLGKFTHAQGLFEYLQLQMPFDDPNKIDDAGKLAVTAYLLARNRTLKAGESLVAGKATDIGIK